MLARLLLTLPSFAIVGLYAAIMLLPKAGVSVPSTALLMCSLLWAFALYLVAQRAQNKRARVGRAIFLIAITVLTVVAVLPEFSESTANGPLHLLVPAGMAFVFVGIGLAASALLSAEGRNDWPLKLSHAVIFFSMAFLPVGIWFLRPRVNRLLRL